VLVAEDNLINQEVIRRMLGRLGHRVSVVSDGLAAVEAAAVAHYDVVLMDAQMPGLDGEAATLRIRALGPEVHQPRIIALTAEALPGDRERLLRAGMDDYLSKPVQPDELERALALAAQAGTAEQRPTAAPARLPESEPLMLWATLANLMQSLGPDGPASIAMIVHLFDAALPPLLDALDAAVAAGDLARVKREAHRLRGGSLQLGAQALASLCRQIEYCSDEEELPNLAASLRSCYAQTYALLRQRYPAEEPGV
jgi:CheY-like chemotaxis protein/HPt (histidine-containing phosphotransfer) domain-containing protein